MPESITYTKSIPVTAETDVLVVGGGPAGIAAAIAAARGGARTRLIERYGYLGGNLTAGLVGPCMTSYSLDGQQQLIKGIFEEMVLRMEAMGKALHPSKAPAGSPYCGFIVYGHDKVTPFDPEAVKLVALDMCREAGVDLQLHTFVADALVEDDAVAGVVAVSKSGLEAIRALVTVDCSADGDVAARAGAAFEQGREEDGLTQPMTLFFRVANVDDAKVEEYVRAHPDDYRPFASLVAQAREAGEFPIPRKGVGLYRTLEPGVWRINTTRLLKFDGTDVRDLTRAEIEGREQIKTLMAFFRKWLPGFEQVELSDTAATMGVRETRRILGEYVLTVEDLASGREFDDVIALCGYPVDIHSPTDDGGGADGRYQTANVYQIPYRSLVPRDLDGLLVAGRCISATHEALGAIRVMPPAFAMGQAAGTAAALAVEWGRQPRAIPVPQLQELLVRQGAYLGERWSKEPTMR
ncbi:MAG: FAD-dependent oxidoreductase [Thermomicrobiales bacterium]